MIIKQSLKILFGSRMSKKDNIQCPDGQHTMSRRTTYNVQKDNIQCPEGQHTMSRRTTYNVQKDNIQCPEGQHIMSRRTTYNVQMEKNNGLRNTTLKTKNSTARITHNTEVNSGVSQEKAGYVSLVSSFVLLLIFW
jgi:ABC-type Na+ efflux pump permease subunit